MDRIDLIDEDPFGFAETFTEKDWRRLERRHRDSTGYKLMFGGVLLICTGGALVVGSELLDGFWLVPAVVSGAAMILGSFPLNRLGAESSSIVTIFTWWELKSGKKILPAGFKIRCGLWGSEIAREPPEYSDREWSRLVRASWFRRKRNARIFFGSAVLGVVTAVLLLVFGFFVLSWIGLAVLLVGFAGGLTLAADRIIRLGSVEAYEGLTGVKVIPERFRARIVKRSELDASSPVRMN